MEADNTQITNFNKVFSPIVQPHVLELPGIIWISKVRKETGGERSLTKEVL